MATLSPFHFFSLSAKLISVWVSPCNKKVEFFLIDNKKIRVTVNGHPINPAYVHVHLYNSPMMTKVLVHADLEWQKNVVRRVKKMSLNSTDKAYITELSDWEWFLRQDPKNHASICFRN